jgi:hypothetical protein
MANVTAWELLSPVLKQVGTRQHGLGSFAFATVDASKLCE